LVCHDFPFLFWSFGVMAVGQYYSTHHESTSRLKIADSAVLGKAYSPEVLEILRCSTIWKPLSAQFAPSRSLGAPTLSGGKLKDRSDNGSNAAFPSARAGSDVKNDVLGFSAIPSVLHL
jgi:hypothetical protein